MVDIRPLMKSLYVYRSYFPDFIDNYSLFLSTTYSALSSTLLQIQRFLSIQQFAFPQQR